GNATSTAVDRPTSPETDTAATEFDPLVGLRSVMTFGIALQGPLCATVLLAPSVAVLFPWFIAVGVCSSCITLIAGSVITTRADAIGVDSEWAMAVFQLIW